MANVLTGNPYQIDAPATFNVNRRIFIQSIVIHTVTASTISLTTLNGDFIFAFTLFPADTVLSIDCQSSFNGLGAFADSAGDAEVFLYIK